MGYVKTLLKEEISIKKIVTIHYFEFAKDYVFDGEKHDFWEFLYVDKGEVEVMADSRGFRLKQGEMIFHKPNEFHNVWANGRVAPNIIVISFECFSPAMKYFENKIMNIGDMEKNLLAQIIREGREAFSSPFDNSNLVKLERKHTSLFGCEQMIKIYLEQLLILLFRKGSSIKVKNRLSSTVRERTYDHIANRVGDFLEENISRNLSFDEVCRFSGLSKTNLKVIFKEKTGSGVMEFFKKKKIDAAKKLIRESGLNFTEIAESLGYTSIHHFSRCFKRATGMTPSEYASSVQVKI